MNFFTQTLTIITLGESPGEDDLGIPLPPPEVAVDIAAWYNPASNQDITQAAADQTLTGYTVVTPNTDEIIDYLENAQTLLLDFRGPYNIVGEYQIIPDGFTIPGYLQLIVDRVRG